MKTVVEWREDSHRETREMSHNILSNGGTLVPCLEISPFEERGNKDFFIRTAVATVNLFYA